ncbi:MAG: hypothetical protein JOZ41_07575, partial [Chloroflexi bacterium]|nr:hypothetical protein [Chloroflexota bacterium]
MSPRYIRRLGLVSCGALLLGAIGLVLYFQFIAGQPGQNLGIIGLLNVPSLIFFSIGFRYICAGLQHWLDQLHAGAPAIDVPVAIRRRVLGLVPRLTMLSAAAWLLAAVGPLATSAWGPGGLGRAVVVALGLVGVGGVLTPAIIYFAADLAWRPAIHAFFPDGRLSAVSSESRPILPRLLVAFLLASVWLPALLVISSLSHTAGLIGRRYTEGTFHHLLLIELILLAAC